MDTTAQKLRYAKLLARHGDPHAAGLAMFPDDMSAALVAATEWATEREVIDACNDALADGDVVGVPTRDEISIAMWNRMQSDGCLNEDYCKMAKVLAEINSYIAKQSPTVTVNNNAEHMAVDVSEIDTPAQAERIYKEMVGDRN